jgi:DNA uptake protein ComE-like DNA-binding protein
VAYFAAIAVGFSLPSTEGGRWDGVVASLLLLTAVGGAVHGALLRQPTGVTAAADALASPVAVRAVEQRVRREQARQLAERYPQIARQLGIGRPDLPRYFDDGGLVDVNGAPGHVLAAVPGVGAELARRIVAEREAVGPFGSVDELLIRGLLGPPLPAPARDALVAVR